MPRIWCIYLFITCFTPNNCFLSKSPIQRAPSFPSPTLLSYFSPRTNIYMKYIDLYLFLKGNAVWVRHSICAHEITYELFHFLGLENSVHSILHARKRMHPYSNLQRSYETAIATLMNWNIDLKSQWYRIVSARIEDLLNLRFSSIRPGSTLC